ncbi:MAG TPA: hypothetical protein VFA93_02875 [Patescibacteria group bacterium]|nr:hypothetical protein [Patescibacteria group bacterium]
MKEFALQKTVPEGCRGSRKANNGPDALRSIRRLYKLATMAPKNANESAGIQLRTMTLEDGRPARVFVPVIVEPTPVFMSRGIPRGGGTSKDAQRRLRRQQRKLD